MAAFASAELAAMQAAQEAHMMDVCQVGVRSTSQDALGELIDSFTYGADVACGLDQEVDRSREYRSPDGTIVEADAVVRLPAGTSMASDSRVKVTQRLGTTLASALTYEVSGVPAEGPSGVVALLRVVST